MQIEKQEIITSLAEIHSIARAIAKNKHVKAVYLFGSYARRQNHNLSDIDLCVVTDTKIDESRLDFPVTDNLDISLFHKLPITLKYTVFKEGKPIIIKDNDFIHELKLTALKKYLDFKPLLNKYLWERFKCTI